MDKNPVWEYYNPCEEDNKFAECNMCQMKFSLGSKLKKLQSVTTLYRHLESKHPHAWFKLSEEKKAKKRAHEGGHLEESGVDVERLFSIAGAILNQKRNRVIPENAEKLLFVRENLPRVNFEY